MADVGMSQEDREIAESVAAQCRAKRQRQADIVDETKSKCSVCGARADTPALRAPLRDGVEAITVGRVKLTRETAVAIEHLTTLGVSSVGSVTGILERVNVHDKNECSIYPPGGWRQVLCQFPDSLLEEIRKGIKRTVTVRGVLIYVPGEPFPRKANITDLKVHPRPEELPTLEDVRELGPWGTDGMSALEFVRAIRNEQEA